MNHTAAEWGRAVTYARSRQESSRRYADNLPVPRHLPGERGLLESLTHTRRLAARLEAEAWGMYADEAEARFADIAEHEMSVPS